MKVFLDLSRRQKQVVAATADVIFLPAMFFAAVWLRFDGANLYLFKQYLWLALSTPLISIPIFARLGLYRAVIRFVDQKIVHVAVLGVLLATMLLAASAAFITQMQGVSRGVFVIYCICAIAYVLTSRFVARGVFLRMSGRGKGTKVAIYGAGAAGTQLASALRAGSEYLPVAFVDDRAEVIGTTLSGIRVYHPGKLEKLKAVKGISEILIAMPELTHSQQKKILDKLESLKIKVKVTPRIETLLNGTLALGDVREVEVEDLLGRDTVAPDPALISACISGKCVMVTGAGGSIGSELCRQILRLKPRRLILLEISEFALYSIEQELCALQKENRSNVEIVPFLGSVLDEAKCKSVLKAFEVETIYHAAAYKHVPLVERNPIEGIRNNVFGTLSIARAAAEACVPTFVLISTDKAVRPTNVMGSSKRLAELILQAFARRENKTRFCMVRFGNVLGSSGSVVPLFRRQIKAGGPITVTHPEITRYFMTIPEAAQLVLQAGAMGEGGEVFVLDMGEPVKILDLAKRMVHLSGLEIRSDTTPEGTIEIQHVGLRPGEKLYEELLIGDDVEGTQHPLIMRAQEAELSWDAMQRLLDDLGRACTDFDHQKVRAVLLSAVSGYVPQCDIEDYVWRERMNKKKQAPIVISLSANQ